MARKNHSNSDLQLIVDIKELEKLKDIVYPILRVLRIEKGELFEYSIEDEIIVVSGGEEVLKIAISEFKEKAEFLFESIKSNKDRTFSVPEIEKFMHSINCFTLKANSKTKTDITIVVHDQKTNQQPTLGFSIKSQLGSPSTLLNAGKTTNFIFKIENIELTKLQIDKVNSIVSRSKVMDRINSIKEAKGQFLITKTENHIFYNNLVLIDSRLPEILSHLIFDFYTSKNSSIADLVELIENKNPLNFDISFEHKFYEYKIKRFLTDVALGMKSSIVWTGQYEANGGYLIIKDDGEVICYNVYNKNEFEDYLFNNTKLETASTTRHDFGYIYEENGELFFKLNLQIRFIK